MPRIVLVFSSQEDRGCEPANSRTSAALGSFGALRAAFDRCNPFAPYVLFWLPTRFRIPASAKLLAALFFGVCGDEILLELLYRAASVADEPADVSGHARKVFGTEDDQDDETYDHHLLHANAEHGA
jgi:hypothetical protein